MANYKTHVTVAALASVTASAVAASVQLISLDQTFWLALLGVIGGMLPDIDAENSRPVRLLFTVLGFLSVIVAAHSLQDHYASHWVLGAAALAYPLTRYGLFALFNRFTEHRGVFHSLLAAVFFALFATSVTHYFLHWSVLQAWLNGLFIAFGFIVHLLLDELYSVDLTNKRMKKSFGTALKLFHYQNLPASILLLTATLVLVWVSPPTRPLRQALDLLHWQVIK